MVRVAAAPESIPGTGGGHEPASVVGNPYTLRSAFAKLDEALNEVITIIESEEESAGSASNEQAMVQKFKAWRLELNVLREGNSKMHTASGSSSGTPQEGGMFTD